MGIVGGWGCLAHSVFGGVLMHFELLGFALIYCHLPVSIRIKLLSGVSMALQQNSAFLS